MPSEVEDGSLQVGRIRAPRQWVEAVSVRSGRWTVFRAS